MIWTKVMRAWIMFKIRTLEADIDGYTMALECLAADDLRKRVDASRSLARETLARLRSEYGATFPAGTRLVWSAA